MTTNANEIKFRASSNGHLMVEPRSKSEVLAEGVKTHLVDIFVSAKYGRREEIQSKFLDKGNAQENDSLTLLSRVLKTVLNKNEQRLTNEYVTAVTDAYIGNSIETATEVFDTKTSWSMFTFFRAQSKLNPLYYWQSVTQMWLTGARFGNICYCLVNGTGEAIRSEKHRLSYRPGMMDISGNPTEKFIQQCKQIELNHIFDLQLFLKHNPGFEFDTPESEWNFDVPMKDRVFIYRIERNEADILRLQNRIVECREWLNTNLFNK